MSSLKPVRVVEREGGCRGGWGKGLIETEVRKGGGVMEMGAPGKGEGLAEGLAEEGAKRGSRQGEELMMYQTLFVESLRHSVL